MKERDEGGDPPCWAHLSEAPVEIVDDAALARLVHHLADAVVVSDGDGTIVLWNDAATALFGWSPDDALGQSLDLIIPVRLRDRHWEGYRRVMATGRTEYAARLLEVPALHRDGRTLSIAFTVTLVASAGTDVPVGVAAVIRDDTARWQERREMRAELAALRAAAPAS